MLKINKINVNIGLIEILKDVSLDLEKGQMVGLIGRNGAGKTTLLRAIMGILPIKPTIWPFSRSKDTSLRISINPIFTFILLIFNIIKKP